MSIYEASITNPKKQLEFYKDLSEQLQQENKNLKKQLEERKYYKFYKYENNPTGSDYCYCQRPCDSNMSLKCFFENGEICGFMSETLVSKYDDIKEISFEEFAHDFIKPLINISFQNNKQQKEFINYLQEELNVQIQEESIGVETINKRYILEEILQKYKSVIGCDKVE